MIKKKIYLLITLISLTLLYNCGYQAIYSDNEKKNIKIKEIKLLGDDKINNNILSILGINNQINEENELTFILESSLSDKVTSKNSAGNPLTYQMLLNTRLIVQKQKKIINEQNFTSNFTYSNKDNKFDLQKLREEIEKNLAKTVADKILIYIKVRL